MNVLAKVLIAWGGGGGGGGIQAKITVLDAQVSYIKLCFYAIKIRCETFAVVV